ncbi:unnamed protein product [Mycena citricolor]|uniref:Xylanolytic transcriptional activator regulatory domain-containing protein n=1 Tax=Mycena citricolor TaxID=2018698 RepID=A0AAD2GYM6_9AGAR|nr:unnamed protein product [Mycena citricolor]
MDPSGPLDFGSVLLAEGAKCLYQDPSVGGSKAHARSVGDAKHNISVEGGDLIRLVELRQQNDYARACLFELHLVQHFSSKNKNSNLPSMSPQSPPSSTSTKASPFPKTAADHVDAILTQSTAYIPTDQLRAILLDVARYCRQVEDNSPSDSQTASSPASDTKPSRAPSPDRVMLLTDSFLGMSLFNPTRTRYFGRSSVTFLVSRAAQMRMAHESGGSKSEMRPVRRPQFVHSPWESTYPEPPPVYSFPPADLLHDLVTIFFEKLNIVFFLLHRPSFERSVASGLHLLDHSFGGLLLAVIALASKFSDDPRVIYPGTNTRLSSGWQWFQQIRYGDNNDFYYGMGLHDVQRTLLTIAYLQGSNSPSPCWILTGVVVRSLQDIGIHMLRVPLAEMSTEVELWKRAYWMAIASDTLSSAFLGRPRATRDEDYELDYPVDCDDEYWEHADPTQRFRQPEGKPRQWAFALLYVKLMEILGKAQKTIYSTQRTQNGQEWTQGMVVELDSALNNWMDSIPEYLRWNPQLEQEPFASQSACLMAGYYHVMAAIVDSAIILLINVWGSRQSGGKHPLSAARVAKDVQKCINALRVYEERWQYAGRYCDYIFTIGNQFLSGPLSQDVETNNLKRPRGGEDDGTQRVGVPPQETAVYEHGTLPMSTEELGTLPIYQSFDWASPVIQDSGFEVPGSEARSFLPYQAESAEDWSTRDWSQYIDIELWLQQSLSDAQ